MPFLKKLLYYGLLAALTLGAVEGMARAAYFLSFEEWYGGGLPAEILPPHAPGERDVGQWRAQHPFYGFAPRGREYELNVMPPWERQDDTVIIGLFGGSVTMDVTPNFREAVYRYFLDNNLPRRPVLLEMSYGAVKQPQQVMIAANTLLWGGHFDIIVNLDGYNEANITHNNFDHGAFPFFDEGWEKIQNLTAAETLLVGRIGVLRAEQARRGQAAAAHPLRYTAVYGIVSRYRREGAEGQIVQLNHELAATRAAYSLEKHGPGTAFQNEEDLSREAARVWYRGSRLLAELAAATGAEYYHFLQPNQYIPGAKPLSTRELSDRYIPEAFGKNYRRAYPWMVQWGEKLQGPTVNYFDLTGIFQDHTETLYGDQCCHLNRRGNELLAAAMVARMEPALRRAATDDRPALALATAARPQPEKLLIDADFQVHRRGRHRLVYGKDGCTAEDRAAQFFLHIVPVDPTDLPADRREYGFENRDFQFERSGGGVINGRCVVDRQLPTYPIASIRTGQYIYGDTLWAGEYHFEQ